MATFLLLCHYYTHISTDMMVFATHQWRITISIYHPTCMLFHGGAYFFLILGKLIVCMVLCCCAMQYNTIQHKKLGRRLFYVGVGTSLDKLNPKKMVESSSSYKPMDNSSPFAGDSLHPLAVAPWSWVIIDYSKPINLALYGNILIHPPLMCCGFQ